MLLTTTSECSEILAPLIKDAISSSSEGTSTLRLFSKASSLRFYKTKVTHGKDNQRKCYNYSSSASQRLTLLSSTVTSDLLCLISCHGGRDHISNDFRSHLYNVCDYNLTMIVIYKNNMILI